MKIEMIQIYGVLIGMVDKDTITFEQKEEIMKELTNKLDELISGGLN